MSKQFYTKNYCRYLIQYKNNQHSTLYILKNIQNKEFKINLCKFKFLKIYHLFV